MMYETRIICTFLLSMMITLFAIPLNFALATEDGRIRLGIAVYESSEMGLTKEDARLITNILTDNLTGIRNTSVYERSAFEAIVDEIRRGYDLIINNDTATKIGNATGVQYIIISSISSFRVEEWGDKYVNLAVACEVNVRIINLKTAEVHLSKSETKSIKTPFLGGKERRNYNKAQEVQSYRSRAIKDATNELAKTLRDEITKMAKTTYDILPSANSGTIQPAVQPQPSKFENKSTDPAKIIINYPLDDGDKNTRRISHLNAQKLTGQKAYEAYIELANSYSGDYLAAYKAGEEARKLKNNNEALKWYDQSLSINPNYEPALRAKMLIQ
ncbi:MAG: CsgG/HfaB family protein [Synergistaceae bacterium]|nr:CsgG/HfaB family protein [Synergistaceae bacterium]